MKEYVRSRPKAERHQPKSRITRFSHLKPIALPSLGAEPHGSRRSPPQKAKLARRVVVPTNREETMVLLTVMYPNESSPSFNQDYCLQTHLPRVHGRWDPMGLEDLRSMRGVGTADGSPPPYQVMALPTFRSMQDFSGSGAGAWPRDLRRHPELPQCEACSADQRELGMDTGTTATRQAGGALMRSHRMVLTPEHVAQVHRDLADPGPDPAWTYHTDEDYDAIVRGCLPRIPPGRTRGSSPLVP